MARRRRFGTGRAVAFSFDDGPAEATAEILALLREYDAKGTFFLIGREIPARRDIVRQMASQGHELGNHTLSHPRLGTLTPAELEDELRSTSNLIDDAAGTRPLLFRPPYGLHGLVAAGVAARLGMRTVLWSVNPKDWDGKGAEAIAARVIAGVEPGAVVVLHDGGGDRRPTIRALEHVLPTLRADGYALVTVSELLGRSRRARRLVVVRRRGPARRAVGRARARLTHRGNR